VVNTSLNALKKENHGNCSTEDDQVLEALLDEAAAVEDQVEFNTLREQISKALSRLAPRQRAAIFQRYYLQVDACQVIPLPNLGGYVSAWLP
jgi:DNA-directed RNA polymerase specialized sigma24 family protein